ncbi:hypothetical protein OUZ56_031660 [Daphnia magna]|uniref:Uncharacterized protein n=1 Tax=Daphnia magna TaxID=35525 RepID=A0ABQ9ZUU7_9CRUS|nr:hypothetical protein OUZ56_031660 [Daphnia magna]
MSSKQRENCFKNLVQELSPTSLSTNVTRLTNPPPPPVLMSLLQNSYNANVAAVGDSPVFLFLHRQRIMPFFKRQDYTIERVGGFNEAKNVTDSRDIIG